MTDANHQGAAERLTAERLAEIRAMFANNDYTSAYASSTVRTLLSHIDALEGEKQLIDAACRSYLADTQNAERRLVSARRDALDEAARLVEKIVVSGPEDDEIDHDDYRDMQIAAAIRALKEK